MNQTANAGLAAWQVRKLTDHIDTNLSEDLSVARLAVLVGLSTGYFSRAFRTSFGASPHAYVLHRRLERARALMRHPAAALSEIALECGFCDQPHLTRRFQEAMGVSPAAWRREALYSAAWEASIASVSESMRGA
jgi:AraC family transcriptional regulator